MNVQLCGTERWKKENINEEEYEGIGANNEVIVLCYVGNWNLQENSIEQSYLKIPISQVEYLSN